VDGVAGRQSQQFEQNAKYDFYRSRPKTVLSPTFCGMFGTVAQAIRFGRDTEA
jgi:hypothetical protein